jgi:moderate conductance mechanosensitive channel
MDMPPGVVARISESLRDFLDVMSGVLGAMPSIPAELAKAAAAIVHNSGAGPARDLLFGALIFIALTLLPPLIVRMRSAARREIDPGKVFIHILQGFLVVLAVGAGMIGLAIVCHVQLFGRETLAGKLGLALTDSGVRYLLLMIAPLVLLRPGEPELRLLPCSEAGVAKIFPLLATAIALAVTFIAVAPVLLNAGMSWPATQAFALLIGAVAAWLGYRATLHYLQDQTAIVPAWRKLALAAAILFALIWAYGVMWLDFPFFNAVVLFGVVVTAAFVLDRMLVAAQNAADAVVDDRKRALWTAVSAGLRRATLLIALVLLVVVGAQWGAEAFTGTPGEARWKAAENAVNGAAFAAILGYGLFEILTVWIRASFVPPKVNMMPGEDEDMTPASRLSTIVPLLQGMVGLTILGATALVVVSRLGVDITPVLAGAGILGLAISFGSQSLVRDVVAGIFYMADDAFRVGEYIEAARLKGTVEKLSFRSMRLRHQNGQIHTVTYGQLGFVTNYSRDWVTMKFNLRFERNTDIDKVRKLTKQLGQDLLSDEEFGPEFIQPLKLQGVADIAETALVLRFKFTVKPGKPTVVQRAALKRMLKVYAENGVSFATNSVIVQSEGRDNRNEQIAAAADAAAKAAAAATPV